MKGLCRKWEIQNSHNYQILKKSIETIYSPTIKDFPSWFKSQIKNVDTNFKSILYGLAFCTYLGPSLEGWVLKTIPYIFKGIQINIYPWKSPALQWATFFRHQHLALTFTLLQVVARTSKNKQEPALFNIKLVMSFDFRIRSSLCTL